MRTIDVDKLVKELDNYKTGNVQYFSFTTLQWLIDNMATVDISVIKHGKWVYDEEDEKFRCSECKHSASTDGDYRQVCTPYCQECGAKMDLK